MSAPELGSTVRELIAEGKGILAADESTPTITKRFARLGIDSTADIRRNYREILCSTSGLSEFVSGVILYDETIRQQTRAGVPFPNALKEWGIIPGIKVDTGAKDLAGSNGEKVTEGLDGLRERLAEYGEMGARFAKWRAVIAIGEGKPTDYCLATNAHALGRYAALCQEAGVVPIVEPEVTMDGDHTIDDCYAATERTLHELFDELLDQHVELEHILLKANMVISGKDCPQQAGVEEVARKSIRCLRNVVPAAVRGVVFLSGGQSARLATAHLNEMNRLDDQPWRLGFSYARALQGPALESWRGEDANREAAQNALHHRARCTSAATLGKYSADMELADPVRSP
ncbi:fructose-bisphosphate aldolase class I [soil metagenome]